MGKIIVNGDLRSMQMASVRTYFEHPLQGAEKPHLSDYIWPSDVELKPSPPEL
jgi:hypothetical protein